MSEVPNALLTQLDLEAARVAYLVDGDAGGAALRSRLVDAGVPLRLIVDLGVPGIENVIDAAAYQEAVAALLPECNPDTPTSALPSLPVVDPDVAESAAAQLQEWVQGKGLRMPSKVAVANWLIENRRAVPSSHGAAILKDIHASLVAALQPGRNSEG